MNVRFYAATSATLVTTALSVASGCSKITHARDFEATDPPPDTRACVECLDAPELRHVPCPPSNQPQAEEHIHYFALRAIDLGTRASGWSGDYKVGLDRDCSERPDGKPVQCVPRDPQATWEQLSGGVDNAFATQVLYPLIQHTTFSPQMFINGSLERGQGGVLLIVDHWNGKRNDKQVGLRIVPSKQVRVRDGNKEPQWDGHDWWIAYADRWDPAFPGQNVPDTENKSSNGYVRDGVLVWDARDLPSLRFVLPAGKAVIQVQISSVVLMASITDKQTPRVVYDGVLSGVWSSFYASRSVPPLAQAFAGCDMCKADELKPLLDTAIRGAQDMMLPTSVDATVCDAISFGILGNYEEVGGVFDIDFLGNLPKSCDGAAPCQK